MDSSPSPATPIVFDLSGLTADQRNGYGWAVGGVPGSGSAHFLSISELRAYGTTGAAPPWFTQPTNATVTAGQRAKFAVSVESHHTPGLADLPVVQERQSDLRWDRQ